MKESRIVAACLAELKSLQGCHAWRNNSGAVMAGSGTRRRPLRFGDEGSGDILGAFLGRAIAVECKTATGRQSAAQKRWQADFERAGGLYVLARNVEQMRAGLGVKPDHPRKPVRERVIHRTAPDFRDLAW